MRWAEEGGCRRTFAVLVDVHPWGADARPRRRAEASPSWLIGRRKYPHPLPHPPSTSRRPEPSCITLLTFTAAASTTTPACSRRCSCSYTENRMVVMVDCASRPFSPRVTALRGALPFSTTSLATIPTQLMIAARRTTSAPSSPTSSHFHSFSCSHPVGKFALADAFTQNEKMPTTSTRTPPTRGQPMRRMAWVHPVPSSAHAKRERWWLPLWLLHRSRPRILRRHCHRGLA